MHILIKYYPPKWLDQSTPPPTRGQSNWATTYRHWIWPSKSFFSYNISSSSASLCPFCFSYQCYHIRTKKARISTLAFPLIIKFPILIQRCFRFPRPPLTTKLMRGKKKSKCYFILFFCLLSCCCCCCCCCYFLGRSLRHMEVPRLGVQSEL